MTKSNSVFIFGYSGHAFVIIESLLEAGYDIRGYFDYHEALINPYALKYCGFECSLDLKNIVGEDLVFPTVGENSIREKLVKLFESLGLNHFVLKDPSSFVSGSAKVNTSTYVGKKVVVNAKCIIGKGVVLNTGCVVEHDCVVSDFSHIAPSSVLCDHASVGSNSFVGANSVVVQNVNVGNDIIVGAATVVTKNIGQKGIWVGNPAVKLQSRIKP